MRKKVVKSGEKTVNKATENGKKRIRQHQAGKEEKSR